jgi:hypothetical protein
MNTRRLLAAMALILIISGCTAAPSKSPFETLPGKWGWEGTEECAKEPAVLRFSSHNRRMHIVHTPIGMDGSPEPRREASYTVTGHNGNVLNMAMDGEDRKDDQGQLVTWNLIVLDETTYCWNRNDWRATACTKSVKKCGADKS